MSASLDVSFARSQFPILKSSDGYIFGDNAGGSQCTKDVADRLYDYLINTNVQLGADYHYSVLSTTRTSVDGPEAAKQLFNADSADEIVFGMSSTLNLENLARSLDEDVHSGEEIIITQEHEGLLWYNWSITSHAERHTSKLWTMEASSCASKLHPQILEIHCHQSCQPIQSFTES